MVAASAALFSMIHAASVLQAPAVASTVAANTLLFGTPRLIAALIRRVASALAAAPSNLAIFAVRQTLEISPAEALHQMVE